MAKAQILVVEDERLAAEDICSSLENLGYTVSAMIASGEEAINRVKENNTDLVLMDILLKGEIDGIEAADQIHSQFDIPVVYLSAHANEELLERAKATEPLGYIIKPFEDKELNTVIEMALYRHKTEQALRQSERELTIRNQIVEIFLTVSDEEIYEEILQVILEATESKKGAFGYIDREGALVVPSLTRDIWDQCQIPDKDIVFPRETWRGFWGRALIEKKALYSNEPFSLPEGHIPIHRALNVPVIHQGTVIGNLIVGNKATDYNERDQELLETIAAFIAPVLDARLQRDREEAERKQAEEALRDSEEKYRDLFESNKDGIVLTDMQGKVLDANNAYLAMLGYDIDEIKKVAYQQLTPEKWHKWEAEIIENQFIKRGYSDEFEKEYIKKDGTVFPVSLKGWLIKDKQGQAIGMWGYVRDITERKKAEEERRRVELRLQESRKMEAIGTLAGGIAHDFNNLLMGIQGNASFMLHDLDSEHPHYDMLKTIEGQVRSGATLTKQLLGYARKGQYDVKSVNLNKLVQETSETFGRTRRQITIHRELAEDLFAIEADQGQIEQILLNFCINAADAMLGGGDLVLKTANATHEDMKGKQYDVKPGNYILLTVTDTGTGMDKDTQARIFDPFFTTKEMASGRGTGLGLASAYGIVKAHAGYIDVESEKGKGTTFSIYLPATEKRVGKEMAVDIAEQIVKGTGTVLLVDDEEVVLEVGIRLLNKLGYTVMEAKSGRKAVELYEQNKNDIDLVLLDMVMPDVGGSEAYDKMKEINPNVKVLLSSGYSIEDTGAKEILNRGCDGFIQKPFNMERLSQSIQGILGKE